MANPLIQLGTLNRLRASVQLNDHPELNVTASFLGRDGINIALEGSATTSLPQMVGVVQSPEPYQMGRVTIHLLKTQAISANYKTQMEANSIIGDFLVRVDAAGFPTYQFVNGAIGDVREIDLSGRDAGWIVSLTGTYYLNSDLFNLV